MIKTKDFKDIFLSTLHEQAAVSSKDYYNSLNSHLKQYDMRLGKNEWAKTGEVDKSQVGIYKNGDQIGKIERIVRDGTLVLEHISAKYKGNGLVRKIYPHDKQFAQKHSLDVYSELVNDYTQDMFLHIFKNWDIQSGEGERAYKAIMEDNTAGAGGVFGQADGYGGSVGNVDFYAPGDSRVPKVLGVTLSRAGAVGKKKKKKKKRPIREAEESIEDVLKTYSSFKRPKKDASEYDPIELHKGTKVEMEHTTDERVAKIIAMNHLDSDPDYYNKLPLIDPEHE